MNVDFSMINDTENLIRKINKYSAIPVIFFGIIFFFVMSTASTPVA